MHCKKWMSVLFRLFEQFYGFPIISCDIAKGWESRSRFGALTSLVREPLVFTTGLVQLEKSRCPKISSPWSVIFQLHNQYVLILSKFFQQFSISIETLFLSTQIPLRQVLTSWTKVYISCSVHLPGKYLTESSELDPWRESVVTNSRVIAPLSL